MKEDNKNKINRRDFFKLAGAGTLASAAALYGCSGNKNNGESESAALGEIPTGKMTYRTNPNTGDRVSLLGYGCMRWPTRKRADGNGDEIDQEAVNDLIDYAIAHGVNYFDTSPAYVQGLSERATGIALKRHPREKFFLATKLSNFSPSTHSREESLAMYHRSFRDLQVDYIDYRKEKQESFVLWNLRANYRLCSFADVFVKGENLLAQRYEINAGFPMPKATVMGGVNINF